MIQDEDIPIGRDRVHGVDGFDDPLNRIHRQPVRLGQRRKKIQCDGLLRIEFVVGEQLVSRRLRPVEILIRAEIADDINLFSAHTCGEEPAFPIVTGDAELRGREVVLVRLLQIRK